MPRTVGVGERAPDFELVDQHGASVTLAEHRGVSGALLVFYPFAFSGVCGSELRALQENLVSLRDVAPGGALRVLAISTDPMYALRVFADREGFDFALLSDFWPHGAVARSYGVFHEERGCATRGSFLVGSDGVVRWRVVNGLGEPRDVADYTVAVTGL